MIVTVVIPVTPSKLLAPNKARTVHYLKKADASRAMRDLALMPALAARHEAIGNLGGGPVFAGPVTLTERVVWGKGERRVDLSAIPSLCKPYEDALTDAQIWGDDAQVVRLIAEQGKAKDGIGFVELIVEGAE